ncbi:hypothetical protein BD410DRAFT_449931 [Rickenella mellea]|uniref:F-box domain-containing protein n=1 Tax=Rickenella mellea TaxID=50990 RepID=A0A4Y7PUK2_9AGAM|nr:hypothetical protein BD410DRAFT_449931 [Rickenella mellea]
MTSQVMGRILHSEDKLTVQCSSGAVQTLAPEPLREIFLHCVSNRDDTDSRCWVRCPSQAPLLLGRVCRTWRFVSDYSPELWSSLAVGDSHFYRLDFEKDLEATKHWISKSGSRPLSLVIHYPGTYSYGALLPPILEFLASQSWRWMEITLTVPSEFEDVILAPFRTGNLPQLVKFDSSITRRSSAEFKLSSAPRLKFLHHSGNGQVHVDFSAGPHGVKRIGIHHSENPNVSLDDLFICFNHCPLLENLSLPIFFGEGRKGLPRELPSTIELIYLTHLSLSFSKGNNPSRLFDRLFLPLLKSLELQMAIGNTVYPDWPHLQTMFAHSRPPLQTLRLRHVPMTEATLVVCLWFISSLTELELHGMRCSDTILESLTVDEGDTNASRCLCPWLETVDFGNSWDSDFSVHAMTEMIVSRRKNASFEMGKSLTLIKCPFAFNRIRSNPDIVECMKDGLVIIGQLND